MLEQGSPAVAGGNRQAIQFQGEFQGIPDGPVD